MTARTKSSKWYNGPLINFLLPAVVFVASAGALYSKVDAIGEDVKDSSQKIERIHTKQVEIDTKVKVLYEERMKKP